MWMAFSARILSDPFVTKDIFVSDEPWAIAWIFIPSLPIELKSLPEITRESVRRIIGNTYHFSPVIRKLSGSMHVVELFHGPSHAFKDFGACFLASFMEEFLSGTGKEAVILVATSGDTGSAVARAFYGKKNTNVVILYPSGRVSFLQEKQLTTLGENISAVEVGGSFDDCQRMVKEAFTDKELRRKLLLTSANSINLGRLIPQSFYYIYSYARLKEELQSELIFCVPSGNFGNLTAGVYAWQWGLPVSNFIAATNINDVVPGYLKTGIYTPRTSVQTLSNAMDVGNPSNLERLRAIFRGDWHAMRSLIYGEVVTDEETLGTIKEFREKYNLLLDPHTAVGCLGAIRFSDRNMIRDVPIVVLSTAHPGKFRETVRKATGCEPELPADLEETLRLPKQATPMDNTLISLKRFLLNRFL